MNWMRIMATIVLVTGVLAAQTMAADVVVTFDGGGDGSSWSDPDNWDGDEVPASGEVAVMPDGFSVNIDVDTAALEGIDVLGTAYVTAKLDHKQLGDANPQTVGGGGLLTIDYNAGGQWITHHANNTIQFASSDDGQGGTLYATLKLILASGDTPNVAIPHKFLKGLDDADLIVDVSNLTATPTDTDPLILFDAGEGDIQNDAAFHNVQITGGSGYGVTYDYDNGDVLLVPEPMTMSILGLGAIGLVLSRRRK